MLPLFTLISNWLHGVTPLLQFVNQIPVECVHIATSLALIFHF